LQPPLQLPLQLAPLLLGADDPPATAWANVDIRFLILRLLHLGQATLSVPALTFTSFSNDTPQLLQSYSKIGIAILLAIQKPDFCPARCARWP
jgi:hypothetical protein